MSATPAVELIEHCVVDVDAPRASSASQDVGIFKTTPALELAARRVADNDALRPSSTSKDRVADVDAP
jgi:hypothetical protein